MLSRLFTPNQADKFLNECWPARPFEEHGDLQRLPVEILKGDLSNIESLLRNYHGSANFSRGTRCPNALPAFDLPLLDIYKMGLTIYLGDIAPHFNNSAQMLAEIERELGVPSGCSRVGAFISPKGEGAPCHYDAEDVFSIQLSGTKTFEIATMEQIKNPVGNQYSQNQRPYADLYPQITIGFPTWKNATFKKVKMKPGSVLFMPRGTWHRSLAHEDSMAISIIISPPVLLDAVLTQLRKLLLQDQHWRMPLINTNRKLLADLFAQLPHVVSQLSENDIQASIKTPIERLNTINQDSRFIRRPDSKLTQKTDDSYQLTIENKIAEGVYETRGTLNFTDEMLALALWVNKKREPFSMAQISQTFANLKEEQIVEFLKVLVRGKVIEYLAFPKL